jgi:hypothetical protein
VANDGRLVDLGHYVAVAKGAFPPSHFSNKLDDKLAHKVALQTNVTHFCLICQSEVCCKQNWFDTNSLRQLCEQVCHQACRKNVMVETHLKHYGQFLSLESTKTVQLFHKCAPCPTD